MEEIKYRREDEFVQLDNHDYNKIPNDWKIIRVGILFHLGRGRVISKTEIEDNEGIYPVYSSQTANDGKLGSISTYDFDGDYITWTTDGANAGTVFRRKGKFNCTNVCGTLKPKKDVDLSYVTYMLSTITKRYVRIDINPKLMNNEMSNIRILYPPLSEQQKIANFLDYKTSQFDSIISKKEELIEKLEEAKKSLISEVVTGKVKIVDGEIVERKADEMKDSGIEWLGKIPKEWGVTKLKYLADHKPNSFTDGDWIESKYIVDQGVRLIQTGNIGIGKYIEKGDRYISEETYKKLNCTEVKENDILICRLAHPVGRACLAPSLGNKMITSVDVCILKPNNQFDRRYIVYSLTNNRYLYYADMIARGGTRQRISRTQLGDIDIYKLPLFEQQKIANFLDIKTSQFDSIISKKEKLIEKLKEAKQSLISEAVTGKIDLRDWEIREVDES